MTQQTIEKITVNELVKKVEDLKGQGYKLVQIGCMGQDGGYEINYSFDKDYSLLSLRINITDEAVPSISGIYWCAFIYENEIHDLFGINVTGIAIDFQGNFYKTAIKTPFCAGVNVIDQTNEEERKA